jgi:hypothetical protein
MKKLNQTYIDSLINKVINESLEEKADKLVNKIKKRIPTDDEVEKMMSSVVTEKMETCEQCGGEMREGSETCEQCGPRDVDESDMGDIEDAPTEFDYVEEDVEVEDTVSGEGDDPLGLIDRYCNKETPDYDKQRCDYHVKNFGGEMNERLHGGQKKLDKNKNGKIDSEDFRMLRKKGQSKEEPKKNTLRLSESELISFIEKIIIQEQKSNIKTGNSKGFEKYKQIHKKDGKENKDSLVATAKKMRDYLKDGSKGGYDTNPDTFPKGNGELAKMKKKAYIPSGSVQDYTDNFTAASLENLDYDGITPNEEWVTDNIEGSSRTGNNPEWANTGKSEVNKKRNKIRKDNMLAKTKRKAYNKSNQPVIIDKAGEDEGDKIMTKLESVNDKKIQKINEEFDRMKSLINYTVKTQ